MATETDESRDRLKVHQFAKNISSFPEWVQQAWADTKTGRAAKTNLVNSIAQRDANGRCKFDLEGTKFEALQITIIYSGLQFRV